MSASIRHFIKPICRGQYSIVKRTCFSQGNASQSVGTSSSSSSSSQVSRDVPGLSARIADVPSGEVGPGASKQSAYKNPEYFCYNNVSYFEAEVEMAKYRLPQPTNRVN